MRKNKVLRRATESKIIFRNDNCAVCAVLKVWVRSVLLSYYRSSTQTVEEYCVRGQMS